MFTALDHWLFLKINHDSSSSFLDRWMPVITDFHLTPLFLGIVVPLFLGYIVYRERERGLFFILALVFAMGMSDIVTYHLIKQVVKRGRPETTDLRPILRVPSHSGYSFPSNHAANVFALAAFTGFVFFRLGAILAVIALLVAVSRIYVGVHFPSDVFAGGLIGAVIATLCWKAFELVEESIQQRTLRREELEADQRRNGGVIQNGELKKVWTNSKGVVTGDVKPSDFAGTGRKKKKEATIILEAIDLAAPEEIAIGDLGDLDDTQQIKK
jgi:undecaprenyl-diphosphatase